MAGTEYSDLDQQFEDIEEVLGKELGKVTIMEHFYPPVLSIYVTRRCPLQNDERRRLKLHTSYKRDLL